MLTSFGVPSQFLVAHFVIIVVLLQGFFLTATTFYICWIRLKRAWLRKNNEERENQFRNLILEFLFASESEKEERIRALWNPRRSVGEVGFLRRLLLAQIKSLRGIEKENLVQLYFRLDFYSFDLSDIRSKKWWKRLEALTRLEHLSSQDTAQDIRPLVHDQNEFVALTALRILGQLESPGVVLQLLRSVKFKISDRKDVCDEIFTKLALSHPKVFLNYLDHIPDTESLLLCVSLMGRLQLMDAVDRIVPLLASENEDVLREAVKALGRFGDPRVIPLLRELLSHPDPRLKAVAAEALYRIDPLLKEEVQIRLSGEFDVSIRRVLFSMEHSSPNSTWMDHD